MIGIARSSGLCLDPPRGLVAVEHRAAGCPSGSGPGARASASAHPGLARRPPRSSRSRRWSAGRAGSGGCPPGPRRRGCARSCRAACASARERQREGRRSSPGPGSNSTQMRPPCSSTIRRAIARPRPVPPFLRVLELSTCWNSSKIRCWSARGDAGAGVGHRDHGDCRLRPRRRIATSPASVNLMALPTRFSSTCVSRRSSPRAARQVGRARSTSRASPFSAASASVAPTTSRTSRAASSRRARA